MSPEVLTPPVLLCLGAFFFLACDNYKLDTKRKSLTFGYAAVNTV